MDGQRKEHFRPLDAIELNVENNFQVFFSSFLLPFFGLLVLFWSQGLDLQPMVGWNSHSSCLWLPNAEHFLIIKAEEDL